MYTKGIPDCWSFLNTGQGLSTAWLKPCAVLLFAHELYAFMNLSCTGHVSQADMSHRL